TDSVLDAIYSSGIHRREVTLHVGAGTFTPVKADNIGDHLMHSEFIAVDRELIEELSTTDKRVIAVGTTSVRTLESLFHVGCLIATGRWDGEVPQWYPYEQTHPQLSVAESMTAILNYLDEQGLESLVGATRIIIAPGYEYKIVRGLVTNFHQPKSTLLLLVSAFTRGDWRSMYNHALESGYRFLSYGDASLLLSDK
ncbi:MAG: S-adenosylmethionine:tRNA ribosyltransferase-isomerase, partial [Muribaculaceae bacterium]|nr:S-adenosylmethionine:tRNA ribosyltransferase-isomerase [Muribaculaceae bacterium]